MRCFLPPENKEYLVKFWCSDLFMQGQSDGGKREWMRSVHCAKKLELWPACSQLCVGIALSGVWVQACFLLRLRSSFLLGALSLIETEKISEQHWISSEGFMGYSPSKTLCDKNVFLKNLLPRGLCFLSCRVLSDVPHLKLCALSFFSLVVVLLLYLWWF